MTAFAHELPEEDEHGQFLLDLDGFDGPIDLLLSLARDQKVDLTKISILALAEQYLAFIERARRIRLELAADYLVMAAWLAFLKSRLLLPVPPGDPEPTGEEMAAALAFQLRRLEAIREAGNALLRRPQLGREIFARGEVEPIAIRLHWDAGVTLYDLLALRGAIHTRKTKPTLRMPEFHLHSIEKAIEWLSNLLPGMPGWTTLMSFVPTRARDATEARSAIAATFGASLELAKRGKLDIRQDGAFQPIYLRPADREAAVDDEQETETKNDG
jgi:segregation and condensation protein A